MFKLKTKSGTYKIWMRARYSYIRSDKKLTEWLQANIDIYKTKPGWEAYAESLQKKLDDRDIHSIASLWGIFSKSVRISDKGSEK